MPRSIITKRPYSETQIYRDASVFLVRLTEVVRNLPRYVQYSIGEDALRNAARVAQLVKLSYEASVLAKKVYMEEATEAMSCLEVTVNLFFDCRYITLKKKAFLYEAVGSMQKQLRHGGRKWRDRKEREGRMKTMGNRGGCALLRPRACGYGCGNAGKSLILEDSPHGENHVKRNRGYNRLYASTEYSATNARNVNTNNGNVNNNNKNNNNYVRAFLRV